MKDVTDLIIWNAVTLVLVSIKVSPSVSVLLDQSHRSAGNDVDFLMLLMTYAISYTHLTRTMSDYFEEIRMEITSMK